MYELIASKPGYASRCDKCRWNTVYIFRGKSSRWQRRCQRCAERMVAEGKAVFKTPAACGDGRS